MRLLLLMLATLFVAFAEETCSNKRIVVIDYMDLITPDRDLNGAIESAYGYQGLGILAVGHIPGLERLRSDLLPLSQRFANLPDVNKSRYELPDTFYAVGWSHGKEKLQGKPDWSKGSFYGNPQYDTPIDDDELIAKYAPFVHPNVWPDQEIPTYGRAFKAMGQTVVDVGIHVARHADKYVNSKLPSYPLGKLAHIINTSLCAKARLLHYFPVQKSARERGGTNSDHDFSNWCGWHNDHGSLTGLVPAMYLTANGTELLSPDSTAGLYIRERSGEVVKASVPQDVDNYLLFQIGETAQIHSGGILQATPHAVRAVNPNSSSEFISRETFAVFMQPCWAEPMNIPDGVDVSSAQTSTAEKSLPRGVPTLMSRWQAGIDFGAFGTRTLNAYH